jgi:hypothetical protein
LKLQRGFQLDIPRTLPALFLITLAGLGLFVIMVGLSRWRRATGTKAKIGADT